MQSTPPPHGPNLLLVAIVVVLAMTLITAVGQLIAERRQNRNRR